MSVKKPKMKLVNVPLSEFKMDMRYQRPLDEAAVDAIVAAYDPDLVNPICAVRRANGAVYVVDGQHTVAVLRKIGASVAPTRFYERSTVEGEAQLFLDLNGNRKAVRIFDKFSARATAAQTVATEITNIVEAAGLRVARNKATCAVSAVGALEHVHVRYNNLATVLSVLTKWMGGDPDAFESTIVRDIGDFLAAHPEALPARVVEVLRPVTPRNLRQRIKRAQGELGCPRREAAQSTLRALYNEKLRAKQRLSAPELRALYNEKLRAKQRLSAPESE